MTTYIKKFAIKTAERSVQRLIGVIFIYLVFQLFNISIIINQ